ncbi:hypothetical protein JVX90_16755 [Gordonia sp. PDNC005]|uniref:hypothetical protein n=1 Tax=unclassified Gordonia (in: high G+C Gram-positive bacteria) TaxID=2657482 RepID=UPI001964F8F2|nr:hypothetical protein [Gordonia sp. PDNC005]QRY62032.1 hypothetical protein JVX90_16755 [Gordonia sp. PDNC005]
MTQQNPANLPPQQDIPNYAQQPVGQADYTLPAQANEYTGFSVGAVVSIVGAVLVLISYPMVWMVAKADSGATVTGLGAKTSGEVYEITSASMGRLHWVAGIAMVVLIVVAVARLLGKFTDNMKRAPIIAGVFALLSAGFALLTIGNEFKAGSGLYLALVGAIVALAGGVVMGVLKK